jgi:hypothetical protein
LNKELISQFEPVAATMACYGGLVHRTRLMAGVFITILTNVVMRDQGHMLDLGMRNPADTTACRRR